MSTDQAVYGSGALTLSKAGVTTATMVLASGSYSTGTGTGTSLVLADPILTLDVNGPLSSKRNIFDSAGKISVASGQKIASAGVIHGAVLNNGTIDAAAANQTLEITDIISGGVLTLSALDAYLRLNKLPEFTQTAIFGSDTNQNLY